MICLALYKIPETSAIGMLIALVGMVLVTSSAGTTAIQPFSHSANSHSDVVFDVPQDIVLAFICTFGLIYYKTP